MVMKEWTICTYRQSLVWLYGLIIYTDKAYCVICVLSTQYTGGDMHIHEAW